MTKKSTYVNQEGDIRERLRLWDQEGMLNAAIDALQGVDMTQIQDILDVACGTGGWCADLARQYPEKRVIGIDNDAGILAFAQAQARIYDARNLRFLQMSALEPLHFPDDSFDLVRMRLIGAFMPRAAWLPLLAECKRVLRPGGLLVVTEQECLISNDVGLEKYVQTMYTAMHTIGYTFASNPDTPHLCIGIMVKSLLQQAGFADVSHRAFAVEFSTGAGGHQPFLANLISAFENGSAFLQKFGGATPDTIKGAQQYLKSLINKEGLIGFWHFITAYGRK